MKIPFHTILGPPIRRNYKTFTKICSYPLLNLSSTYACLLGIFGMGMSLFDIIRIIRCGSVLPCSLWRSRIQTGKVCPPECERDLKLISLVLSLEYYMLLIFGTFMKNQSLFLPWLILYTLIIFMEFLVFVARLFLDGFNIGKHTLLLSIFIVYNWLAIFCAFFRFTGGCDF